MQWNARIATACNGMQRIATQCNAMEWNGMECNGMECSVASMAHVCAPLSPRNGRSHTHTQICTYIDTTCEWYSSNSARPRQRIVTYVTARGRQYSSVTVHAGLSPSTAAEAAAETVPETAATARRSRRANRSAGGALPVVPKVTSFTVMYRSVP